MIDVGGYIRALKNYIGTPKGRHDVIDYARAIVMILLTAAAIALIIKFFIPPVEGYQPSTP